MFCSLGSKKIHAFLSYFYRGVTLRPKMVAHQNEHKSKAWRDWKIGLFQPQGHGFLGKNPGASDRKQVDIYVFMKLAFII